MKIENRKDAIKGNSKNMNGTMNFLARKPKMHTLFFIHS